MNFQREDKEFKPVRPGEGAIGIDALIARWGGGNKGAQNLITALERGLPMRDRTGAKVSAEVVAAVIFMLHQRMRLSQ